MLSKIPGRLKSRKLWITIAGILGVTVAPEQADHIVQIIAVYLGAQGAADTVKEYRKTNIPAGTVLDDGHDEVDTTRMVSGSDME